MSLKSHEEIGHVGRVGTRSYEEMGSVEFTLYRTSIVSRSKLTARPHSDRSLISTQQSVVIIIQSMVVHDCAVVVRSRP